LHEWHDLMRISTTNPARRPVIVVTTTAAIAPSAGLVGGCGPAVSCAPTTTAGGAA
jgi:hypothetical protein